MVALPVLSGSGSNFGTVAQTTVPPLVAAMAKLPVAHLLLHDIDQGIRGRGHGQGHASDRVRLPLEHADCADIWDPTHCAEAPCAPEPATVPPSFAAIFWDAAVSERREQSLMWFRAFKKAGGLLDELVQDSEEGSWGMESDFGVPLVPTASLNASAHASALRCIRARYTAIQNDARFVPIAAQLSAWGFVRAPPPPPPPPTVPTCPTGPPAPLGVFHADRFCDSPTTTAGCNIGVQSPNCSWACLANVSLKDCAAKCQSVHCPCYDYRHPVVKRGFSECRVLAAGAKFTLTPDSSPATARQAYTTGHTDTVTASTAPPLPREWLADTLAPFSDSSAPFTNQTADATSRAVWNAVMTDRISVYWRQAFGEPARQFFPNLRHSNYGQWQWSPDACVPEYDGWMKCRAGVGASGLNVAAPDLYNEVTAWSCHSTPPDKGCDGSAPGLDIALRQFQGVPFGSFNRSAWNAFVFHGNQLRSMMHAANASEMALRPWPAYKSFSAKLWDFLPATGPTHYYQETLLHATLVGADAFHFFNPWTTITYGTRATLDDYRVLSQTLRELDSVLGCPSRQWLSDAMAQPLSAQIGRWNDSFHLTGAMVGLQATQTTVVWRFAPAGCSNAAGHSTVEKLLRPGSDGLTISPVTVGGQHSRACSLVFGGGSVVRGANGSAVAPFGVWVHQSGAANVELRCPQ